MRTHVRAPAQASEHIHAHRYTHACTCMWRLQVTVVCHPLTKPWFTGWLGWLASMLWLTAAASSCDATETHLLAWLLGIYTQTMTLAQEVFYWKNYLPSPAFKINVLPCVFVCVCPQTMYIPLNDNWVAQIWPSVFLQDLCLDLHRTLFLR